MHINYDKKYIAFIDVLGFTELVGNPADTNKLESYFDSLEEIFRVLEADKSKAELKMLSISDSVILMTPGSEDGLKTLLRAIQTLQSSLAQKDIWMRGGLAFGSVFYDEQKRIIVGPGFIRAFKLEGQAIFPRVIIDPIILRELNMTLPQFNNHFNGNIADKNSLKLVHNYANNIPRLTDDDAIFVCYANKLIRRSMNDQENSGTTVMDKLCNDLNNRLYGKHEHYHKYLWTKKYFEEVFKEEAATFVDDNSVKSFLKKYWVKISDL